MGAYDDVAVVCAENLTHRTIQRDYEHLLKEQGDGLTWEMLTRLLPKGVFVPADPDADDAGGPRGPTYLSAVQLLAKHFADARSVVPRIAFEGASLFAGREKSGKSWAALGMAVAVAAGGAALGTAPCEAGEVLYLALEDGQRRLQKRLEALLGDQAASERLTVATEYRRLDDGGLDDLDLWLAGHPGARLVVIDTLKRVRPHPRPGATLYEQDYDAMAPLADLAKRYRVAILVIHHTRKQDSDDPLDLISGTTGLAAAADGVVILRRARGAPGAELHVTHKDADDADLALKWDDQLAGWRLLGDAEEHRRSDERSAVLRALTDGAEPLYPRELAEVLEKPTGTIRKLLWSMVNDGQVRRDDRGRYLSLSPPAKSGNGGNAGNGGDAGNAGNGALPRYRQEGGPVTPPVTGNGRHDGPLPRAAGADGGGGVTALPPLPAFPGGPIWTLCTDESHAGTARTTANGEVCGTCHPAPWQEGR